MHNFTAATLVTKYLSVPHQASKMAQFSRMENRFGFFLPWASFAYSNELTYQFAWKMSTTIRSAYAAHGSLKDQNKRESLANGRTPELYQDQIFYVKLKWFITMAPGPCVHLGCTKGHFRSNTTQIVFERKRRKAHLESKSGTVPQLQTVPVPTDQSPIRPRPAKPETHYAVVNA